jgi:hypothetical protein
MVTYIIISFLIQTKQDWKSVLFGVHRECRGVLYVTSQVLITASRAKGREQKEEEGENGGNTFLRNVNIESKHHMGQ